MVMIVCEIALFPFPPSSSSLELESTVSSQMLGMGQWTP